MAGSQSPFHNVMPEEGMAFDEPFLEEDVVLVPVEELEDGSSVYDIEAPEEELEEEQIPFDANLAEYLEDNVKSRLVSELLEKIDDDLTARKGWETALSKGISYLGLTVEESRDYPFANACNAFDSTLATALYRHWAVARAELYPSQGPVRTQILGPKTYEQEQRAERIKAFFNYYLTIKDKDYYPDSSKMLVWLGMAGGACKKVFQSPLTQLPISRMINPQDFIIDGEATSFYNASRLTHRMVKTKKELMLLMINGFYSYYDLDQSNDDGVEELKVSKTVRDVEGVEPAVMDVKKKLTVYEIHADIDLEGFEHLNDEEQPSGLPLPYIITVLASERKLLSVKRNWRENDPNFERIECFTPYEMLPGFGIYGIGYAQLLGSNAIALTSILRQLIDKGSLCNFPGGVRVKGLRLEENDINIGPSEFWEIETGGMPIRDAIMPMPYGEPSSVLKELREKLQEDTQQLASTAELQIADMNNETPVGTTMAMLEIQTKVQSSVMRGLHMSLTHELGLLYELFREGLAEDPGLYNMPGMSVLLTKEDFADSIRVIPVSDPNLTTGTQRMMHAEAILRLAQANPELHDLRNAYHRMYLAMNVEDIDSLLPPEEKIDPLDPISENMFAMQGKPIKAGIWQDHESHIAVHEVFSLQNPDIEALKAHIHEHRAQQYMVEMQNALGYELPPIDQLQDPRIQNAIAMQAAKIAMQQQQHATEQNPPPIDPTVVMMEEVKQKDRAAALKNQEAQGRVELESFKATLQHEIEKERLKADLEIAEQKSETELEIAQLRLREAELKVGAQAEIADAKMRHESTKRKTED